MIYSWVRILYLFCELKAIDIAIFIMGASFGRKERVQMLRHSPYSVSDARAIWVKYDVTNQDRMRAHEGGVEFLVELIDTYIVPKGKRQLFDKDGMYYTVCSNTKVD